MNRRTLVREAAGCAILVAFGALACTSLTGTTTGSSSVGITTYQPQTGIQVDSNALFNGLGCGHGPGLPFKYIVQVYGALCTYPDGGAALELGQPCPIETDSGAIVFPDAGNADGGDAAPLPEPIPVAQSVNDCYSDAVFQNLTTQLGAGNEFFLVVTAYDDVTFDRSAGGFSATQIEPRSPQAREAPQSCCTPQNPVTSCYAGSIRHDCTKEYPEAANWTTTCLVHQSPNVQSVAACAPLASVPR